MLDLFNLCSKNDKEEELVLDMMITVVQKYTLDVNTRNYLGLTPVMEACSDLLAKRIEFLLRVGANLDSVLVRNGKSAAHMLSKGYDLNDVPDYEKRLTECFEILLNARFDIHQTSYTGNTTLYELCTGIFDLHAVKTCLKHGLVLHQKKYIWLHSVTFMPFIL